jgi:hypothetical protein
VRGAWFGCFELVESMNQRSAAQANVAFFMAVLAALLIDKI